MAHLSRELHYRPEIASRPIPPDRTPVPEGDVVFPSRLDHDALQELEQRMKALQEDLRVALASVKAVLPDGTVLTLPDLEEAYANLPDPKAIETIQAWRRAFSSPDTSIVGWFAPTVLGLVGTYQWAREIVESMALPSAEDLGLQGRAKGVWEAMQQAMPQTSLQVAFSPTWTQMGELARDAQEIVHASTPGYVSSEPFFMWDQVALEQISVTVRATGVTFPTKLSGAIATVQQDPERFRQVAQQASRQLIALRTLIEFLLQMAVRYAQEATDQEFRDGLRKTGEGLQKASRALELMYEALTVSVDFTSVTRRYADWFWGQIQGPMWRDIRRAIHEMIFGTGSDLLRGLAETLAYFEYGEQNAELVENALENALFDLVTGAILKYWRMMMDAIYSSLGEYQQGISQRLHDLRRDVRVATQLRFLSLTYRVLKEVGIFLERAAEQGLSAAQIQAGVRTILDRILEWYPAFQEVRALFMREGVVAVEEQTSQQRSAEGRMMPGRRMVL